MLPKALYGCETWFSLTTNNILLLERVHRFCVKYMQGLSTRTRTVNTIKTTAFMLKTNCLELLEGRK